MSGLRLLSIIVVFCSAYSDAATITLRPTRASGVQGVDWMFGPGEREITFAQGGQDVEIKIYLSDWAPEQLAAYQATLDCGSFESNQVGRLSAIATDCTIGEGDFGVDFCLGVNEAEPDYVLGYSGSTLPACGFLDDVCPSGDPGPFACGSVDVFAASGVVAGGVVESSGGGADPGVEQYAMQFSFAMSDEFLGYADILVLGDQFATFMKNQMADDIPIDLIEPARISVTKGACCSTNAFFTACLDDVTVFACDDLGDSFFANEICDGLDSDGDGAADICDACPGSDDFVDGDNDGVADGCDPCPNDPFDDSDGDGVCDTADTCPGSDDRVDSDGDGVADGCDQCPGQVDTPRCLQVVPTVSSWGLVSLALLLLIMVKLSFHRRTDGHPDKSLAA